MTMAVQNSTLLSVLQYVRNILCAVFKRSAKYIFIPSIPI